jgi:hypothetical protein
MNWNTIAATASTIALFVPVLLIISFRLFKTGSLFFLSLYYLSTGVFNLMSMGLLNVSAATRNTFGTLNNYMDAPLMFLVLLFFGFEKWHSKVLYATLALFVAFEAVVFYYFGLSGRSSTYILGPNVLFLLTYSIFFFLHYGKISIVHGKGTGKTFMLVSILFSYGCFGVIYYLYYIEKHPRVDHIFLIYYIVTCISSILMCIGLVWVHRRSKKIQEIQLTRKELTLFFNH